MAPRQLHYPTPDGVAQAQIFLPPGAEAAPLLIFCMDAFGLRPTLEQMAERLCASGYAVALPELYWRSGPYAPFDPATTFHEAPERARVMALMNALQPAQVAMDVDALLEALGGEPGIGLERVGLLGYCMGGRHAFLLASHLGSRAAAVACIHGGGLVRPDPSSPHLRAGQIRARCYFGVADEDHACTPQDCETLGAALSAAGVVHEIELYPGALHGFAMRDMTVYQEEAAERHWAKVLALFGETLAG
jgi:carboxymethylenebutenolidase